MKQPKPVIAIGLGLLVVLFSYNNCGKTTFNKAEDAAAITQASTDSNTEGGTSQSQTSDDEIVQGLPPSERDTYRPISDLEKYPELKQIYSCATDAYYICHFPSNVDSAHTLCVGKSAVETHRQHEAAVDASGQLATLSDYLGPCKHKQ